MEAIIVIAMVCNLKPFKILNKHRNSNTKKLPDENLICYYRPTTTDKYNIITIFFIRKF